MQGGSLTTDFNSKTGRWFSSCMTKPLLLSSFFLGSLIWKVYKIEIISRQSVSGLIKPLLRLKLKSLSETHPDWTLFSELHHLHTRSPTSSPSGCQWLSLRKRYYKALMPSLFFNEFAIHNNLYQPQSQYHCSYIESVNLYYSITLIVLWNFSFTRCYPTPTFAPSCEEQNIWICANDIPVHCNIPCSIVWKSELCSCKWER